MHNKEIMKMENKKKFVKPEVEIIKFEGDLATDDVVATSGVFGPQGPQPGDINNPSNGWW